MTTRERVSIKVRIIEKMIREDFVTNNKTSEILPTKQVLKWLKEIEKVAKEKPCSHT